MKLKELLKGIEILETNMDLSVEITDVVYDSRKAAPGSLFVAITGFAVDGNRFMLDSIAALDRKSYKKIELYL